MSRFLGNRMGLAIILLSGTVVLAGLTPSLSQTRSHKSAFDVASVKRRPSGTLDFSQSGVLRGNRYIARNYTFKRLVQVAYGLPFKELLPDQIIGGPQWINTDSFDVEAKVDDSSGSVPLEQVLLMLRSLLEDRFHLKAHLETRELSVYDLVVAKPEKPSGTTRDSASAIGTTQSSFCVPLIKLEFREIQGERPLGLNRAKSIQAMRTEAPVCRHQFGFGNLRPQNSNLMSEGEKFHLSVRASLKVHA